MQFRTSGSAAALMLTVAMGGAYLLPSGSVQAQAAPIAYVNFLNGVPGSPAGSIYVDGTLRIPSLRFAVPSRHLFLSAGVHHIQAFAVGAPYKGSGGVVNVTVSFKASTSYSLIATGTLSHIQGLLLSHSATTSTTKAHVSFVDLVQDAPPVDIRLQGSKLGFTNVSFPQMVKQALAVKAGSYVADLYLAGHDKTAVARFPLQFSAGKIYTVYALGLWHGKGGAFQVVSVVTDDTPPQ